MGIRVGIDLGTTFSAVARIDPATGRPVVIKNSFGSVTTPSVLCFQRDGTVLFGEDAKNMQSVGDTNAVAFFKRSMGQDLFSVDVLGKTYTETSLSAILLQKLKEEAEQQCGETITSAVITVPAYFAHKERCATLEAGRRAGLDVITIINEPTAAALAYGLNQREGRQIVLIYDLGGGTFDVTLARIDQDRIEIIGSDGDHELGGKDWDDCIARYLASEFEEQCGVDLSQDAEAIASLLVTAEQVKKQLTSRDSVQVPLAYGGKRCVVEITEEIFEAVSQFLLGSTKDVTQRLLDSVEMSWNDIDGVILVGGSTRMRMIRDYVREMSGKAPLSGVNVDEAVALGAAIRANISESGEALLSLGGGRKQEELAAIQGAKAVTDVTAHSLGMIAVSVNGEAYVNSIIIRKNTRIPAANTRPFDLRTRARDNELEVYVLQGEFERPLDNTVINKYVITDIENTAARRAVIQVTYQYTKDGIIEVSAVQKETGKTLPVNIQPVPEDMSWTDGSPRDNQKSGGKPASVGVMLAVDLSGSMTGRPLEEAKRAMKDFVGQMDRSCTRIGLIPFADRTKCEAAPTGDFRKIFKYIDRLSIGSQYGYGNEAHPFDVALRELRRHGADVRYLVVLTDGAWSCQEAAIRAAKRCHKEGIEVMALGFGSANYRFLKQIASTDEFAAMTDLSQLSGSFSKIAQAIEDGSTGLRAQ